MPMDGRPDGASAAGRPRFDRLLLASACRALENARQIRARRRTPSRPTARQLGEAIAALRSSDLDAALRHIDRSWRCAPDDPQELLSIYARLLVLDAREPQAALGVLRRVDTPAADLAALTAHTLLQLDRGAEARHTLDLALAQFCVAPDGLLAAVAAAVSRHPGMGLAGWIGRGPNLDFVGELAGEETTQALQVRLDSGARFIQPLYTSAEDGRPHFQFRLPQLAPEATLEFTRHAVPLLGSGCRATPQFGLDGRTSSVARTVSGWVRINWNPTAPVALRVEDDGGRLHELETSTLARSDYRWAFDLDLDRCRIPGNRIQLSARHPDGGWQSLPDMPLLLDDLVRLRRRPRTLPTRWTPRVAAQRRPVTGRRAGIDVIIPVYRGRLETLACIDAVLDTAASARVVVVDDATQDPALAVALDALAAAGCITLLRNAVNLGFVGSVNRALARNRTRDVVLLNSDTVVFGDWLTRLRDAAYRAPHVGTVTPFSNNGSIASYPRTGADSMSIADAAALHRLAADTHSGAGAALPVGVGFCLYVRRACLDQVGGLDESVFGKGYGEETDFCLRAARRGWSHWLAADVFVHHAGARSFAGRRDALLHRSQRLLNLRHPGYDAHIAAFLARDPLASLRRALDEQRLAKFRGKLVLIVTLALKGGVSRFVNERCRALRAQGRHPVILRPPAPGDDRHCELWTDALDAPNLHYDIPSELDRLTALLRGLSFGAIEIQHFLHLDPRVIEAVRALGIPYAVVVHDYAWICPRVTLVDRQGRYCGEPAVEACVSCVERNGSELRETISVAALRRRSAAWLAGACRVTAPSADAAARLERYIDVAIDVQAPTTCLPQVPARPPRASPDAAVRVALIGAIGDHKGYRILLDCARDAALRRLRLHFIVIGHTYDDAALLKTGKVFVTGEYGEGEVPYLLRRERPDMVWLASRWPETWSYALDDALAARLPVVAFDLGAIAERLRGADLGTLLPLETSAPRINETLLQLAAETALPPAGDMDIMRKPVEKIMHNPPVGSTQPEALSASLQLLPLTAGLYLFSVKAAAASPDNLTGQLKLPALHVGLGPGVQSGQVEFIAGPTTDGAWLFAKDDCLVTKVNGGGATLVLTSVRAPGGDTLSIKVERLDSRVEAPAVAAFAAPVAAAAPAASPKSSIDRVRTVPSKDKIAKRPVVAAADLNGPVPLSISAHIRTRGDMTFSDAAWAGRVGPGLWIESFSVVPGRRFAAGDVEYKGLTGSGFETPWVTDAAMCGTRGMAVPLVGFAIRLKPGKEAAGFDCEYSGYFKSGVTVGPLRNGAPCRSTVANDPLEGIQVQIRKHAGAGKAPVGVVHAPANGGPSFGRYRDANHHAADAVAAPKAPASVNARPAAKQRGKSTRAKRTATRRP